MTYSTVKQSIPRLWKKEYWPYVATTQCLLLCIRRHGAAIEVGDLQAAQKSLGYANQLMTAAFQAIQIPSAPSTGEAPIQSLIPEHLFPPMVHGTVLPDVAIANFSACSHTSAPLRPELYSGRSENRQPQRLSMEPYPRLIQWSGKTMSFVILAALGVVLAGCIALIANQIEIAYPLLEMALRIVWRLALIAVAIFITGTIIASLKAQ